MSELVALLDQEADARRVAPAASPGSRRMPAFCDWLAAAALLIPWLIAGYWVLHVLAFPRLWPLLFALLVGSFTYVWRNSRTSPSPEKAFGTGGWALTAALLMLVLAPPIAHASAIARSLALHPLSTDFAYKDDASEMVIARGLEHGYPPPDLTYVGKIYQYHYGQPLLVEFIHRATALPFHRVYYGVLPGLFSFLTLVSLLRVLWLLFPEWSINRLLLAVFLAEACVLLDAYNVIWHFLSILHSGVVSQASLNSMPMATLFNTPVLIENYGSAGMAVVLLLVFVANIDRCGPFTIACTLFAIYLTKQQLFLPLGVAWSVVALAALVRKREVRALAGLGIGTALVVVCKIVTPFEAGFTLQPAFNDYFIRFGRGPDSLAPVFLGVPAVALFVVAASALLGTHIYGPALYATYIRNGVRLSPSGRRTLLFIGAYFLSAFAIMVATVLVMNPTVAARFDAIYNSIGDLLWLPEATYRVDMMNVSLAVVLAPCGSLFSVLATGAILQWHKTTPFRAWRAVLSGFCVLAIGGVAYNWTQLAAWHPPSSWHVVSDSAVEVLRAAKENPGVILTNDLRFQPGDHLPLMNSWAPQLFGQQFYASNLMYGSFAYPDVLDRLEEHQSFWSTPAGEHHRRFLAENDIKYLLIRRDMPFPADLLDAPWVRSVLQNADYSLLEVI